jgi:hypothetical protein
MDQDPTPFFIDFKDAKNEKKEESGSITLTYRSGTGRPKNMRIRIPNTGREY